MYFSGSEFHNKLLAMSGIYETKKNGFERNTNILEVTGNKYLFGAKAKFFGTQSNVNSTSRLIFGNPLTCQSLEICFNSPLLKSIKKREQNYNWLVNETKFRVPLKPICISQIIC